MSHLCFVKNCTTSSGRFFHLPLANEDEIELRKRWIWRIGRCDEGFAEDDESEYLICEKHFSDKQFEVVDGVHQLKLDAEPDTHVIEQSIPWEEELIIKSEENSLLPDTPDPLNFKEQETSDFLPQCSSAEHKISLQPVANPSESEPMLVLKKFPTSHTVTKPCITLSEGENMTKKIIIRTLPSGITQTSVNSVQLLNPNQKIIFVQGSNVTSSPILSTPVTLKSKEELIKLKSPNIPTSPIVKPKVSLITISQKLEALKAKIAIPTDERNVSEENIQVSSLPHDTSKFPLKKTRPLAPKPYIPVAHYCRLCAANKSPMIDIYSQQGDQLCLLTMVSTIMNMKLSMTDKLPLKICVDCIRKLQFCYEIILEFTMAKERLLTLLKEEEELKKKNAANPIPLLLIENETNNQQSPKNPPHLRVIREKLVHVDKNLPAPEQIAQVIETVKAGLGTDNKSSNMSSSGTSKRKTTKQKDSSQNKEFNCLSCNENLPDWFTLIQHQLLKFHCRTCRSRFCSNKSRQIHYREVHRGKTAYVCYKCKLRFQSSKSLSMHRKKYHSIFCQCCNKAFLTKAALIVHIQKQINAKQTECMNCGTDCKTRRRYMNHVKKNVCGKSNRIYICEVCNKEFNSEHKANLHLITHQPDDKNSLKFHCKHCPKSFMHKSKLTRHMKFHMDKQIQCPICPRKFTISTELKYHLEVHANERKHECDFCGTKFLHKVHLTKHIRNKHLQENYYVCEICNEKFETKSQVEEHCAQHPVEDKLNILSVYKMVTPFQCNICNKYYASKYGLDSHIQLHKDKELGSYLMCEFCGRNFASQSKLNLHLKEHTGVPEQSPRENKSKSNSGNTVKRYTCQVCSNKYSTTVQLLAHMACHTGIKPFKCSFCEATFTTKMNKNNHELRHKGIKNHTCEHCQKSFYGHYNLVLHMRTHTKEKPYQCTFCPKAFPRRSNLTTHLRVHTGDRPYTCDICNHAFSQKTSRDKHLLTHTQEKLYSCEHCTFACNKRRDLTEHSETAHGTAEGTQEICLQEDEIEEVVQHTQEAEFQIQIIEQEVITYE